LIVIVIKIELHSARTSKVTELGSAIIDNINGRDGKRCDYRFRIVRKGQSVNDVVTGKSKPTRTAIVEKWPRHQKTIWQMLRAVLNIAYE